MRSHKKTLQLVRNDSMGKCVSKQVTNQHDWPIDNAYLVKISEEQSFVLLIDNEGQSESKKQAKRSGPETKGTAMSFGFKKKLYTTNKKKTATATTVSTATSTDYNRENEMEVEALTNREEKYRQATVISNTDGLRNTDNVRSDDNGNRGSMDELNEKDRSGRITPRLTPPRKESTGVPYRSLRFGFRQGNIVRPVSAGLHPKNATYESISNNNNIVTEKQRSKSASSTTRTRSPNATSNTYNRPQHNDAKKENPKIASSVSTTVKISYQQHAKYTTNALAGGNYTNKPPTGKQQNQQQYAVINTNMHTNDIIRPVPQQPAALVSKFTLHTASLPRPQYPVPISLTTRHPIDTKVAKQAANTTRRGFYGPRDISTDSGISSIDNNTHSYDTLTHVSASNRHSNKSRPRNLEMVFSGRNKFEVRDLDDSLSDESIVPLTLPQLPSAFNTSSQTAPLMGLSRTEYVPRDEQNSSPTDGIELTFEKSSLTSLDVESIEEEKLYRDNSTTEKDTRMTLAKEYSPSSKTSSPASSRASWCNAGESMAIKDCSSLSISSSESMQIKDNRKEFCENLQDEDLSLVTITMDNRHDMSADLPVIRRGASTPKTSQKHLTEVLSIEIEDDKFAQITEAAGDIFLDDETSPTVSLVSTDDSDEIISKKNKKKINDSIKEKNNDDISPLDGPLSPETPSHASNSLSLSDVARDFLIDDEIADQPALCFSKNHDVTASTQHLHSLTDTPTLIETSSMKSAKCNRSKQTPIQNSNNSYAPQVKPRRSLLSRTESLDTLSPCESIASDDLMMDFECHSSMDSIDGRMTHSNYSGSGSALHSLDEAQLFSELEQQGGTVLREWSTLLRSSRNNSRDRITPQLPARATRLLNRSRIQQPPHNTSIANSRSGSDSPRSLDSFQRKISPRPSSNIGSIGGGRDSNSSPDDNNAYMMDKSLRNAMIQDVLCLKKQLIHLRSVLQEPDEENLTRTDTLNPFDLSNGQFFGTGIGGNGFDGKIFLENKDLYNYASAQDETKQELVDLRRQVVYLQGQIDDKDRTIRIQQSLIDKLQIEMETPSRTTETNIHQVDTTNTATQTERLRPLSMGQDGLVSGIKYNESASLQSKVIVSPSLVKQTIANATQNITNINSISNNINGKLLENSTVKKPLRTVKTTQIGICPSGKLTNGYNRTITTENSQKSPQKPIPPAKPITSPVQRQIPRLMKQSCIITENSPNTVVTTTTINGNNNDNEIYQLKMCKPDANNDNDDLFDKAKSILNENTISMRNSLNVLKSTNFA